MKLLWISGWAVPPAWFAEQAQAAFLTSTHQVVSPTEAAAALKQGKFDVIGGYSLGALWLLKHQNGLSESMPVLLLAPIFSFAEENGDGGRVSLAQLRLQRRRFRQDAKAAITDFYRRSGMEHDLPAVGELSAEKMTSMEAELGWLEDWRATNAPPQHWLGFIGKDDVLLDAEKLQQKWPRLKIVPDAGHAPGPLLRAASLEFGVKIRS